MSTVYKNWKRFPESKPEESGWYRVTVKNPTHYSVRVLYFDTFDRRGMFQDDWCGKIVSKVVAFVPEIVELCEPAPIGLLQN